MNRYNIDTCALLVEFASSVWTARKLDKTATDEVVYNKRAASKDAARVNKHLLAGRNELELVQQHVTAARNYVYENTLPWSDSGIRLLPTAKFTEFNDRMGKFEEDFVDIVNTFITIYPSLITAQAMALGDMFDRSEFPTPESIAHKFSFRVNYMPVPKAGDFRVDIGNDAQTELQTRLAKLADERVEAAMAEARDRLKTHLDRMMERLKVEEVNGKVIRSRIHGSLVEGGLELCDALKSLNIINDQGEEHMTNYDRWKLATPNYLEDEDDGAISRVHSTIIDGEDGPDLRADLRFDSQDAGQELDRRHQEDQ
jgi:hypothetical protein